MILKRVAMIVKWCNCANDQFYKRKIILVGDSSLNGINKKGLSKKIGSR